MKKGWHKKVGTCIFLYWRYFEGVEREGLYVVENCWMTLNMLHLQFSCQRSFDQKLETQKLAEI